TPRTLFEEPATAFVAQFLGWNVITDASVAQALTGEKPPPGKALAVRPELLQPEAGSVDARVTGVQFLGTHAEWMLSVGNTEFRAWVSPETTVPERTSVLARRHRWLEDDVTALSGEP